MVLVLVNQELLIGQGHQAIPCTSATVFFLPYLVITAIFSRIPWEPMTTRLGPNPVWMKSSAKRSEPKGLTLTIRPW